MSGHREGCKRGRSGAAGVMPGAPSGVGPSVGCSSTLCPACTGTNTAAEVGLSGALGADMVGVCGQRGRGCGGGVTAVSRREKAKRSTCSFKRGSPEIQQSACSCEATGRSHCTQPPTSNTPQGCDSYKLSSSVSRHLPLRVRRMAQRGECAHRTPHIAPRQLPPLFSPVTSSWAPTAAPTPQTSAARARPQPPMT